MKKQFIILFVVVLLMTTVTSNCFGGSQNLVWAENMESKTTVKASEYVVEDGVLVDYNGTTQTVVIPEGVTEIAEEVFSGNDAICDITLPDSLKVIGARAFYDCERIAEIDFKQVEVIGEQAFAECESMQGLVFPATVQMIEKQAFYKCKSLKYILFEDGIETIGEKAFASTESVKMVKLAASIKELGDFAFAAAQKDEDKKIRVYAPDDLEAFHPSTFTYSESVIPCPPTHYKYADSNIVLYGSGTCKVFGTGLNDYVWLDGEFGYSVSIPYEKVTMDQIDATFDYTWLTMGPDGDVTMDGKVNLEDAQCVLCYALGILTDDWTKEAERADFDKNGQIQLYDAKVTLQKALGIPIG